MSKSENQGAIVDVVVKLGGSTFRRQELFDSVIARIAEASRHRRLLVVPGGGPFADAVREAGRRLGLSDDAAHWMAVLAMDESAELVASKLSGGAIVRSPEDTAAALHARRIPVLAPSNWLRQVDPLPHDWDVTSDSIAAWVAGEIAAPCLVLIKPPGAGPDSVDRHFERSIPGGVEWRVVAADDPVGLEIGHRPR